MIVAVLLFWWIAASVARWSIARHYCERFRLLTPTDVAIGWQLCDELGAWWAWTIRLAAPVRVDEPLFAEALLSLVVEVERLRRSLDEPFEFPQSTRDRLVALAGKR